MAAAVETRTILISAIMVGPHSQRFKVECEDLDHLRESIRRLGLINPVGVVGEGGGYRLVHGHRRLRACKDLGRKEIEAVILDAETQSEDEVTFAENFFRTDLTPVELAVAIAKQLESGKWTVEQIAAGFHRSADWVRRQIAITEWPDEILGALHSGGLSIAAAEPLAQVTEAASREFFVRQAVESGATARTTSSWLQGWRAMLPPSAAVQISPGPGGSSPAPAVPQVPCIVCSNVFRVDAVSHVPVCCECVRHLRDH